MGLFLIISFLIFIFMGIPIVFAMGLSGLAVVLLEGHNALIVIQTLFTGTDSFTLTAIPFYILAGDLMGSGGITVRLIAFAQSVVGHLRGGLAYVNIVASMIFGGVSGSATADTAAVGSILVPAMEKEGYDKPFASAVTAAAGTLGIIIPPSIPMIIFGCVAGESIGRLFLGGFIPGVMIGLGMMIPTYFISKKKGYPKKQRVPLKEMLGKLKGGFWALIMPIVIIGFIVSGIVTPTEAGVIADFYALIVGFFIYKELKIHQLPQILIHTVIVTASIMIIMSVASLFSWLIADLEIPKQVANAFMSMTQNKYIIIFLINIFLLIVGCFVDMGPAIIIITPILLPLVKQLGVDPIHFGLIMTINLGIGLFTPPVGTNLYVACAISKVSMEKLSIAIMPFTIWCMIVLLIISYIPQTVLFIPNLFMK